ncbi:hypothetical protein ACFWIW_03670 [Amycolatopsis sp. NPDC058340]
MRNNGIPLVRASSGDVFVPAAAALGTAIAFRQAEEPVVGKAAN